MQYKRDTKNKDRCIINTNYSISSIITTIRRLLSLHNFRSIPKAFALAFLFGLFINNSCFADIPFDEVSGLAEDYTTIQPIPSITATPPTISLSLNKTDLISTVTTIDNTVAVDTNVTVTVSNADSYNLILSVDKANLTNGNTTIVAGNAVNDNTWGYRWDNANAYTAPTTSGTPLSVPTLNDGNASFTKTLTFGVKFAKSAEAGHYQANGTLSLVATPRTAVITLANLTQMQQLTLAPEACANTPYISGQNYSEPYNLIDVRDGYRYTVRKLGDGKCWMTSNLQISNRQPSVSLLYTSGRKLNSTTSNITATSWTLPASNTSGFSSDTASNVYYDNLRGYGYYSWCAATAGTCSSAPNANDIAPSSICPKGWRLPTGGRNYTNGSTSEFYNLIMNGILKDNSNISSWKNNVSSNHYFTSSDAVDAIKGSPYNFAFTGYVYSGTYYAPASNPFGYWWSSTANSSTYAYYLTIGGNNSYVYPGTSNLNRRAGYAVRCVAQ